MLDHSNGKFMLVFPKFQITHNSNPNHNLQVPEHLIPCRLSKSLATSIAAAQISWRGSVSVYSGSSLVKAQCKTCIFQKSSHSNILIPSTIEKYRNLFEAKYEKGRIKVNN